MRTFSIQTGDSVVVNRHFSVKITRVNGNQVQLELGETNGNAVGHIEITRVQPTRSNVQPTKRSGPPSKHHHGNRRNPYMMGKSQRGGNDQSRNQAIAKSGR
jgi:hypothetical protein